MNVRIADLSISNKVNTNQSITMDAAFFLSYYAKVANSFVDGVPNPSRSMAVQEILSGIPGERFVIPKEFALPFFESAKEDMHYLETEFMINYSRPSEVDFDELPEWRSYEEKYSGVCAYMVNEFICQAREQILSEQRALFTRAFGLACSGCFTLAKELLNKTIFLDEQYAKLASDFTKIKNQENACKFIKIFYQGQCKKII